MAKIAEPIKVFMVQRLACYDTPSMIAAAVKEAFGVVVSRQHVESYDPAKTCRTPKWCELHATARASFIEEMAKEPAAHRAFRIRRLSIIAQKLEDSKNLMGAAQIYEQIAKESGDYFTNSRKLTHAGSLGGGVLAVPVPITDEQWQGAALAQQAALMKIPAVGTQGTAT